MRIQLLFLSILLVAVLSYARTVEKEDRFTIRDQALSIDLDIDGGIVQVRPSENARDCIVRSHYQSNRCQVDIRYNESRGQLDIFVDTDGWEKKDYDHDNAPTILVELPGDPEISFTAHIKAGETEFELGGLHIANYELTHWAGVTEVRFSEPNKTTMRTFDVNVKVGEVKLLDLGNAHFEEADINSGIGELTVDFSGECLNKSMARIDLDIGETRIVVPESIGAKLRVSKFLFLSDVRYPNWFARRGPYYYSENYDNSEKTLYLMISTGIGELGIQVN